MWLVALYECYMPLPSLCILAELFVLPEPAAAAIPVMCIINSLSTAACLLVTYIRAGQLEMVLYVSSVFCVQLKCMLRFLFYVATLL